MKCSNLVQNQVNCLYVALRISIDLGTKADHIIVR